jgi:anti-sigma factor RsiW
MAKTERGRRLAHLSPEEVVEYIDRVMSKAERRQVDAHLAECDRCLTEIVEVTEWMHKPLYERLMHLLLSLVRRSERGLAVAVTVRLLAGGALST